MWNAGESHHVGTDTAIVLGIAHLGVFYVQKWVWFVGGLREFLAREGLLLTLQRRGICRH
jgi:hypothetical protein